MTDRPTDRHRVVVIGSGFGGLFAAKALRRAPVEVTVVARTTHHLFQPLLYQVATGILSEGEIAPATREVLRRQRNARVLLGDVSHIDLSARTVTSQAPLAPREVKTDAKARGASSGAPGEPEAATPAIEAKPVADAEPEG